MKRTVGYGDSPTLKDVAEQAGVSVGTASQALNGRPNVSPETRARVIDVASLLGYQVRDLKLRPVETTISVVGLLIKHDYGFDEHPLVNPFYSHVQAGVEQACRRAGLSLMLGGLEVDHRNQPLAWPAMIEEQRIDGLLIAGVFLDGSLSQFRQRLAVPIVLIDAYASNQPFDSIVTDNVEGSHEAVAHLIALGHRTIGLIGWTTGGPLSFAGRREGYERALREGGLAPQVIETVKLDREGAYEATLQLLHRVPDMTAIFTCNDEMAIGVMRAARSLGRQIPQDLSVVGFDNIDLAREIQPSLTTVHVQKTWMGNIGLRRLIERAQNPDQPRTTTTIATSLIIRESTCPPHAELGGHTT